MQTFVVTHYHTSKPAQIPAPDYRHTRARAHTHARTTHADIIDVAEIRIPYLSFVISTSQGQCLSCFDSVDILPSAVSRAMNCVVLPV